MLIGPWNCSETMYNETEFTIGKLIKARVKFLQPLINVIMK